MGNKASDGERRGAAGASGEKRFIRNPDMFIFMQQKSD